MVDGSITVNSVALFEKFSLSGVTVRKVGGMRNIGAAAAMQYGMKFAPHPASSTGSECSSRIAISLLIG